MSVRKMSFTVCAIKSWKPITIYLLKIYYVNLFYIFILFQHCSKIVQFKNHTQDVQVF